MTPRIGEGVYVRAPRAPKGTERYGVVKSLLYSRHGLKRVGVEYPDGATESVPPGRVTVSVFSELFRPLTVKR